MAWAMEVIPREGQRKEYPKTVVPDEEKHTVFASVVPRAYLFTRINVNLTTAWQLYP